MDRAPVPKHPGVVKRSWRTPEGVQVRYDATHRGRDRRRVTRTFRKLGNADRWLRDQRSSLDRGDWRDPKAGRESLGEFYTRWRERAADEGRPTERKLLEYDRTWRMWIAPKLGDRSLAAITRTDVEAVFRAAAARSAWRAHDTLKLVRRLLSAAVDQDLVSRNVASRVKPPRIERDAPWVVAREDVARIAAAMPTRYRALVLLGAYTSLRWSELAGLRIGHVNLAERTLHVEETLVETAGRLIVGQPKTPRSRRALSIPQTAALALEEHLAAFPPDPGGLVFTAPEGGPVRRPHFGTAWRKATAAVGLAGFPVRNLRHCGATWALEAGADPVLVAFRLGHTTTRMVETHYADRLKAADREIADRLDATRTSAI